MVEEGGDDGLSLREVELLQNRTWDRLVKWS